MIDPFKPRMDILSPDQKLLWPQLDRAPELGLVLYGGTAIALRIGHRFSVDFDFFTEKPLDKDRLREAFPFIGHSTVIRDSSDTFTVLVSFGATENEHVKVSFFGRIGFGRVGNPERTEDGVLQVASLDDLMATKIKVILQRIQAKDYMDIAAMVRIGVSLGKGLAAARQMFGPNFQPSECLKAMVYFEGGDLHTLSSEVKKTLIEAVKRVRELPRVVLSSYELALPIDKHINHKM